MRWLLVLLASCYNPRQPACGFACGPGGACPQSYSCNADDGFCHRDGTDLSCAVDAGTDSFDFFPRIATVMPDDMSTDVGIEVSPTVKFTEQMIGVSTTSFTLIPRSGGDAVAATVSYDDASRTATLDPDAPLANSTIYDAALGPDIVDLAGKALVGPTSWAFATIDDHVSPTLVDASPLDLAVDVPIDVTIVATFSERVSHLTASSFLLETGTTQVPGNIGFVSTTATSLTPAAQLAPDTLYRVTLTSEITDLVGNVFAPVSWTFTTGPDAIAPTITAFTPADGDTDVPLDAGVFVFFSESVVGVSAATVTLDAGTPVDATVTYADAGHVAHLVPNTPLAPATLYTMHVVGITDGSGNPLAATTWSFTTAAARLRLAP